MSTLPSTMTFRFRARRRRPFAIAAAAVLAVASLRCASAPPPVVTTPGVKYEQKLSWILQLEDQRILRLAAPPVAPPPPVDVKRKGPAPPPPAPAATADLGDARQGQRAAHPAACGAGDWPRRSGRRDCGADAGARGFGRRGQGHGGLRCRTHRRPVRRSGRRPSPLRSGTARARPRGRGARAARREGLGCGDRQGCLRLCAERARRGDEAGRRALAGAARSAGVQAGDLRAGAVEGLRAAGSCRARRRTPGVDVVARRIRARSASRIRAPVRRCCSCSPFQGAIPRRLPRAVWER